MRLTVVGAALIASMLPVSRLSGQPPVFTTGVEIVAVDARVVDKDGRPIEGLTASDFTVTVGGRPRRVVSAEFIPEAAEAAVPPEAGPHDYATNEHAAPGRVILLVVDTANLPRGEGRTAIRAAERLLDRLQPTDQLGLITLARGGHRVELTTDHALVRRALAQVVGMGDPSDAETATISLNMLRATFDVLQKVEGRKIVVLVTPGFAKPDDEPSAFRRLGEAAASANCSLFCVRVRTEGAVSAASSGSSGSSSSSSQRDSDPPWATLYDLVEAAGGGVFDGWPERAFERISREISSLYVLGFEPEPEDRDGRDHDIEVMVARSGAVVRARRSIKVGPAGGPSSTHEALMASLRAPQPATALPLRVATHALRGAGGDVKILISTELRRGAQSSGVHMAYVLLDAKGKAVTGGEHDPKQQGDPDATRTVTTALAAKPGQYALKLAARNAAGQIGRVDAPVNATLRTTSDKDVLLSDLLLGTPPRPGVAFRPDVSLEIAGGSLLGYLEIYATDPTRLDEVHVAMEILTNETAPPVRSVDALIVDAATAGRKVARAPLPLADLRPGHYLVRAVVSRGELRLGSVIHEFQVTPPPP